MVTAWRCRPRRGFRESRIRSGWHIVTVNIRSIEIDHRAIIEDMGKLQARKLRQIRDVEPSAEIEGGFHVQPRSTQCRPAEASCLPAAFGPGSTVKKATPSRCSWGLFKPPPRSVQCLFIFPNVGIRDEVHQTGGMLAGGTGLPAPGVGWASVTIRVLPLGARA